MAVLVNIFIISGFYRFTFFALVVLVGHYVGRAREQESTGRGWSWGSCSRCSSWELVPRDAAVWAVPQPKVSRTDRGHHGWLFPRLISILNFNIALYSLELSAGFLVVCIRASNISPQKFAAERRFKIENAKSPNASPSNHCIASAGGIGPEAS